jgi:hypothetical protein
MDGIAEFRDQLSAIGTEVEDRELVFVPLNGFTILEAFCSGRPCSRDIVELQ